MLLKKLLILISTLIYVPSQVPTLASSSFFLSGPECDLEDKSQKTQLNYRDYVISFIRDPSHAFASEFIITHYGRELFREAGLIELYVADDLKLIKNIMDITHPVIIVRANLGGSRTGDTLHIVQLDPEFKILGEFYSGGEMEIEKLAQPLNYRIKLLDNHGYYEFGSFPLLPSGQVILHFNKDKYFVAIEEMLKAPLIKEELEKIINDINDVDYSNFKYLSEEKDSVYREYLERTVQIIFDLIYSGRSHQSWEIINKTWPGDGKSKLLFISDIQRILKTSEYYKGIVELNKSYNMLEKLK